MQKKKIIVAAFLVASILIGIFPSVIIPVGKAASSTDISVAIIRGLNYLNSTQAADGHWGVNTYPIASTAMAVLAFENFGYLPENQTDPYRTTVQNGLNWLLSQAYVVSISGSNSHGNPDTNGNGIGIGWYGDGGVQVYETPMVLMAIVASNAQTENATTGPVNVVGRTYSDIAQDIVDWIAWAQNSVPGDGVYEGGWRYQPQEGSSDNSVCQWPVIGLIAAELWGINAPTWVKTELLKWITADQNLNGNYNTNFAYGAFDYTPGRGLDSPADTATGILELTYCGFDKTDPRIIAAEGYLNRDWNPNGYCPNGGDYGWNWNIGDLYDMYAVMKACRLTTLTINSTQVNAPIDFIANYDSTPGVEWYNGTGEYADALIANQGPAHGWPDASWNDWVNAAESGAVSTALGTAWGALTLENVAIYVKYPLVVGVVDAYSGEPVPGAIVATVGLENQSGITKLDGTVLFNETQAGSYLIMVSKAGYIDVGKTVDLTQVVYVTIELAQTGPFKLSVNIVNSCSQPISNASVEVANNIGFTNASGIASFKLPRGSYNVSASHSHYQDASYAINLTSDENITLTLGFPYVFMGQIADSNIIITAMEPGYNITLLNTLGSSSTDVFFDWDYMGTIPSGTWRAFTFNHLPTLVVEAASEGSPDYPNAWYRNPVPPQLSPINGGEGAFLPEPTPYVAANIFVNPNPPVYGENVTIGVRLHNPLNHPLHISRIDFQLSGLTVGGYFSSVGNVDNVTMQVNETTVFSILWLANVSGHHCVRVVLTYSPESQTCQLNLDVEDDVIAGGGGQVSFTLVNPEESTQEMTIRAEPILPAGWQATLEINGHVYDASSDNVIDMPAGQELHAVLKIESNSVPGTGVVAIEGYVNGKCIGGVRKEMHTYPVSDVPLQVTAGKGGTVTVQSSAIVDSPVTVDGGSGRTWHLPLGTALQLEASPNPMYKFVSWTFTGSSGYSVEESSPSQTIEITGGETAVANFIPITIEISNPTVVNNLNGIDVVGATLGTGGRYVDATITIDVSPSDFVQKVQIKIGDTAGSTHKLVDTAKGEGNTYAAEVLASDPNLAVQILTGTFLGGIGTIWTPDIAIYPPTIESIVVTDIYGQTHEKDFNPPLGIPTVDDIASGFWGMSPSQSKYYGGDYQGVVFACPVDILVTDSQNRSIGAMYQDGVLKEIVNQIPGAYFLGEYESNSPKIVIIPFSPGSYKITGYSFGTGSLNMTFLTTFNGQFAKGIISQTGSLTKGEVLNYSFMVDSSGEIIPEYNITFNQTGVGSEFTGTVVTIDGTSYSGSDLPAAFLWVNGSTHAFEFQSPLSVGSGAKEYDWISTNGLSSSQLGSITVSGPGSVIGNYVIHVHDVAVTNVTANRVWVFQGQTTNINVTVSNNGDFPENLTVSLYYNITDDKIVGTQNITLLVGESKTILFVWNTAGVPYCRNYTLTAVAAIPADYVPSDNTLAGGAVRVRILGDINGDDTVNLKDVFQVALSFGAVPGDKKWNSDADMNGDGKINLRDFFTVCLNFGKGSS